MKYQQSKIALFLLAISALALGWIISKPASCLARESEPQQAGVGEKWVTQRDRFLSKNCKSCHNAEEPEGELDFGKLPYHLADRKSRAQWDLVLQKVADGEMPPDDASVHPSRDAKREFLGLLKSDMLEIDRIAVPGGTILRRLSQTEYMNSINDIFDNSLRYMEKPASFPIEISSLQFDTNPEGLFLSGPVLAGYVDYAMMVANRVVFLPPKQFTEVFASQKQIERAGKLSEKLDDDDFRFTGINSSPVIGAVWMPGFRVKQTGLHRVRVKVSADSDQGANGKPMRLAFYVPDPRVIASNRVRAVHATRVGEIDITGKEPHWVEVDLSLQKGEHFHVYCENRFPPGTHPDVLSDNQRYRKSLFKVPKGSTEPAVHFYGMSVRGPIGPTKAQRAFLRNQTPKADAAYIKSVLIPVAERAYRRPLSDEESEKIVNRVLAHAKSTDIAHGLHYGIRCILCSPHFLYHNKNPQGKLKLHAVASRLAYFLWSSIPDQELHDLAESGKLSHPEVLKAQVLRMLKSPKSYRFTTQFTGQWLLNQKVLKVMVCDRKHDWSITDNRVPFAYYDSTELFFDEILRNNLSIRNFIDSNFTYMSDRQAATLGLDLKGQFDVAKGETVYPKYRTRPFRHEKGEPLMKRVVLDKFQVKKSKGKNKDDAATALRIRQRGGILGLPGFLLATGDGTESSPIKRGVWVLDNLFGMPVGEPPDDVPPLGEDTSKAKTIAEMLKIHTASSSCASCHRKIDPIGLALEKYDAIGKWREHYRSENSDPKQDNFVKSSPVRFNQSLPTGQKMSGPQDVKEYLLANPQKFTRALTTKLLEYATGRSMSVGDKQVIRRLVEQEPSDGYKFRDLIVKIVQSEVFLAK